MRGIARAVAAILVLVVVAIFVLVLSTKPPVESKLIENFYTHRNSYEELKNMLVEDQELRRVGPWGIQTASSITPKAPSEIGYSLDRYNHYLALLKETGDSTAFRGEGQHPDVGIQIWTAGFGGDIRHINLCWQQHTPDNVVGSLKDLTPPAKPRRSVFRHIDGNWYLWTDLE